MPGIIAQRVARARLHGTYNTAHALVCAISVRATIIGSPCLRRPMPIARVSQSRHDWINAMMSLCIVSDNRNTIAAVASLKQQRVPLQSALRRLE